MDHIGDMLNYIQAGLEAQGYHGNLAWEGVDRYRDAPPDDGTWEIDRQNRRARALMTGKDWQFLVTIQDVGWVAELPEASADAHAATA